MPITTASNRSVMSVSPRKLLVCGVGDALVTIPAHARVVASSAARPAASAIAAAAIETSTPRARAPAIAADQRQPALQVAASPSTPKPAIAPRAVPVDGGC